MSVVSPKLRLVQNQLNDVFGMAMFLASAERTQHKDRLIGHELEFHRRLTPGYRKSYEFAAAAIDPDIRGARLPAHSRHGPIESGNFDYVMQHVALFHSGQSYVRASANRRQEGGVGRLELSRG